MKVENAKVTWLESGLPYSTQYQDIYYSKDDELAESQYIFLDANRLSDRWQQQAHLDNFQIGELGFGSGLNFLQVIKLWKNSQAHPSRLHYIAFEKHPLTIDQLRRIHQRWPTLSAQSALLLEHYIDHSAGCHRLLLDLDITLDLYYGDALQQLNTRMTDNCPPVHCWFLDGFSPANNEALWEENLMHALARSSDESTTLSSYSVAGRVRTALKNAGFKVHKAEGFGRKRHSLTGTLPAQASQAIAPDDKTTQATPWFDLPGVGFEGNTAAIIGAGLAGCSTAYSLARRGWQVTLIDASSKPASKASGNSPLALRCRLFNSPSAQAEFFLHAYLFAQRQFAQLFPGGDPAWKPSGVLQMRNAMNKRNPLQAQKLDELYSPQIVGLLSKELASLEAGIPLSDAAWHFPAGGALNPSALCQRYLAHPNIHCIFDTAVNNLHRIKTTKRIETTEEIKRTESKWALEGDASRIVEADVVVIANSHDATKLAQCSDLPLQSFRGQTTVIAANEKSNRLGSIVSGARTVFPSVDEQHLISASYATGTQARTLANDTRENLRGAASNFTEDNSLSDIALSDRVSVRCNSPDGIPLVGMMPDSAKMRTRYGELTRNARAKFSTTGHDCEQYTDSLFLNVAHGSNGLASCPLSAEFLASLITKENLPLSEAMINTLNPSRFLIKDLKKQR